MSATEDEAFKAWLLEKPDRLESFIQQLASRDAAMAESMPMEERLRSARYWVWNIGARNEAWDQEDTPVDQPGPHIVGGNIDLLVRCGELDRNDKARGQDDPPAKACGERMGRFWNTPTGHYGEVRWPVSFGRSMHGLGFAMRVREEENDEAFAQFVQSTVDEPIIMPILLETGHDVIMGCKRHHGALVIPAAVLIAEADSPRRKLHLKPCEWRGCWNDAHADGCEHESH